MGFCSGVTTPSTLEMHGCLVNCLKCYITELKLQLSQERFENILLRVLVLGLVDNEA